MIKIVSSKSGELFQILNASDYNIGYGLYRKLLRKKDIKINGIRINKDITVAAGDLIELYITHFDLLPNIETVYEDNYFLMVNKPQGIEVCDGEFNLQNILKENYPDITACHRLDRNTAGIVVFSKNETALEFFRKESALKNIEKYYVAHVEGILQCHCKTFKAYLFNDKKKSLSVISDIYKTDYLPISTEISTLKVLDNTSVLKIMIKSGRTHQIRAHLAYLGFPILGDGKYNKKANRNNLYKKQALIAYKLKFNTEALKFEYLNSINISVDYENFIKTE